MGVCSSTPAVNAKHPAFAAYKRLGRPLVFGHRGGSKKYPENTLRAFQDAQANGADGVELDVFLTSDGKVIVFHDDNTERLTGANHDVLKTDWATLSQLRHKTTLVYDRETLTFDEAEPITLLEDVFRAFQGTGFLLNVELKPANPAHGVGEVGRVVANMVRQYRMESQVLIISFDFLKLLQVERTYPGLNSGWQYDDDMTKFIGEANTWYENEPTTLKGVDRFTADKPGILRFFMENSVVDRALGATVVDLEHTVMDDNTIAKFHHKGFAVGAFTMFPTDLSSVHRKPPVDPEAAYLDGKNILRQLMRREIDWIETDSVALSRKAIEELKAEFGE